MRFSAVLNPTLTPSEFLELALLDFGISNIPSSKAQRLTLLEQFLVGAFANGQVPVLVVDEAHKLPPDVLEEIRLLSNFERAEAKLLQIVLAGQTELGALLNREDLRQLKQRVAVRLAIHPLSSSDVERYIEYRWQKAGATKPQPFEPDAIARIGQYSRGIPRLVNVLCDNALMLAYAEGIRSIGTDQITEVAGDLDLLDHGGTIKLAPATETARSIQGERNGSVARAAYGFTETKNAVTNRPVSAAITVPMLERYQTNAAKPSRLMRLAEKLGLSTKRMPETNAVQENEQDI